MIRERLQTILTHEELSRVSVSEYSQLSPLVILDVHHMKCHCAKRLINNIINVINNNCQLIIIHGYNGGTAIKEMLLNNFNNNHILNKYTNPNNYGVTYMTIAG